MSSTLPVKGKRPTLPNLIIIGAMKAGTTSLHTYLAEHPEIHMSAKKELKFFVDQRGGLEGYKSNFDARYPVNGESSPLYSRYPLTPGVPERIKEVIGAPKIIYMVRDPVDRILSQYHHMVARLWERRTLEEVVSRIQEEGNDYRLRSAYFFQLRRYLDLFPRERIRVCVLERLSANPKDTMRQIFRFLEVDEDFWSAQFAARRNAGEDKRPPAPWVPAFLRLGPQKPDWMPWRVADAMRRLSRVGARSLPKPKLSPEADLKLQEVLKPEVEALRNYLGDPLPEWRPYA